MPLVIIFAKVLRSYSISGLLMAMLVSDTAIAATIVMNEKDIRGELIGPRMRGTYVDGRPWSETYYANGNITYRDSHYKWQGNWSFRGAGFCTFYNAGRNGGCWKILKTSENCYEFYSTSRAGAPSKEPGNKPNKWVARGWRTSQASTCNPEVGV